MRSPAIHGGEYVTFFLFFRQRSGTKNSKMKQSLNFLYNYNNWNKVNDKGADKSNRKMGLILGNLKGNNSMLN